MKTAKDYAREFRIAGISSIPIRPDGSKAPSVPWKEFQSRIMSEGEIEPLFSGRCGIAVIGGAVSGNLETLDVDSADLVEPFEALVESRAPGLLARLSIAATPRNNWGGRHYRYRTPGPVAGNTILAQTAERATLIETRGEGGYSLAPGCPGYCHPTGNEYRHVSGPELRSVQAITEADHAVLWESAKAFNHLVEDSEVEAGGPSPAGWIQTPGDAYGEKTTWEEILLGAGWRQSRHSGGLTFWVRPGKEGSGISASTGCRSKGGRELLCVFSSNAPPFSGPSGGRSCSSYSKFAAFALLNYGGDWTKAAAALAEQGHGQAIQQATVNLGGILGGTPADEDRVVPAVAPEFPEWTLRPGGVLEQLIQFSLESAWRPQPAFAMAGIIALAGTVLGRKVTDFRDSRTNVYCMCVGVSSSGKEHARKVNKALMAHVYPNSTSWPEGIASHAGLCGYVERDPSILFQVDEIGHLLAVMGNPQAGHLYKIGAELMKLYSSSNSHWTGEAYADTKHVKSANQPNLCLLGCTTPASLYDGGMGSRQLLDGFIGRMLFFRPDRGKDRVKERSSICKAMPFGMMDALKSWWDYVPGAGNLARNNPVPEEIPHANNARDRYREYSQAVEDRFSAEDEQSAAVWSKACEKVNKLALIHACLQDGPREGIEITLDSVNWAIALVNYSTRMLLYDVNSSVVESNFHRDTEYVRSLFKPGMTRRALQRRCRKLRPKEFNEIVDAEIANGYLRIVAVPSGGRPSQEMEWVR